MFKPLPMQHVTLYLIREDAPAAALVLAEQGVFAPQTEEVPGGELPDSPGTRFKTLYANAARRLDKILAFTGLRPVPGASADAGAQVTELELARINDVLGPIWREFSRCEEAERRLAEERRQVEQLSQALTEYESLDVDLGLLQGELHFLDVQLGTAAARDIPRLRQAVGLIGCSLSVFKVTDGTAHLVLVGLADAGPALRRVLKAASFRPVTLPQEFRAHPTRLREELEARRARVAAALEDQRSTVARNKTRYWAAVQAAARTLARAAPYQQLADVLRGRGGLVRVSGWVPGDRVAAVRDALERRLGTRVMVQARDPAPEERLRVPSAFRYPRLLRPFAALVRGYGIPRYGETDPTWLFALTFPVMFGMMFGDVGQGAVITAAGLCLPRKWRLYVPFVAGAGIMSVVFGVLYGSVFGVEMITPLWLAPLTDPAYMLKVALYWGIGFILAANIITVRNRLAERHYAEALLDTNGAVGTVFYLSLIDGVHRLLVHAGVSWAVLLGVTVSLAVILARIWRRNAKGAGERALIVLVEGFETVMRYISNTLSFLRLAAFSLNHVALAFAIYMLAGMLSGAGHWVTVVLGNAFMLVLEGGIVGIQALRLEYYEGFSRFFSGDGRAFSPLTLSPESGDRYQTSDLRMS